MTSSESGWRRTAPSARTSTSPAAPDDREADLGLEAHAAPDGDAWRLTVRARRFAQWVALDIPGFAPEDSWFHVAPDSEHAVALRPLADGASPKGRVRALNGLYSIPLEVTP